MTGQFFERLIHGQHLIVFGGRGDFQVMDVHPLLAAPVAEGAFAPGSEEDRLKPGQRAVVLLRCVRGPGSPRRRKAASH